MTRKRKPEPIEKVRARSKRHRRKVRAELAELARLKAKQKRGTAPATEEESAPASSRSLPIHTTDPEATKGVKADAWSSVPKVPPAPAATDQKTSEQGKPGASSPGAEEPVTAAAAEQKSTGPTAEEESGARKFGSVLVGIWALGGAALAEIVRPIVEDEEVPAPIRVAAAAGVNNWMHEEVVSTIMGSGVEFAHKYGLARFAKLPCEAVVIGAVVIPAAAIFALKRKKQAEEEEQAGNGAIDAEVIVKRRERAAADGNGANGAQQQTPPPKPKPEQKYDWSAFGEMPQ